ncbi:filamentous hemagglutinin N-terminal domain-containing protein [Stutzerimonas sp. VN223-3]|uniref:two-partner secretion domain-containing protein n=1 Tax=Stutzerimonas sp. VN223-3 TaxID=3384601 RepID=UPI0038B57F28
MDVRSPIFQNVATVLVGVMFLNPIVSAAADLTVAAGSGATVGQAANGVPVVNIAAPNSNGLSHNKFKDYNVGQQGLILNNATERTQSTQLGGIILGNSNLNGIAAGLILNEVTGSNASRLQGYTEVAGKSAHVIVANPHGISCDGCGFINTPRVTLSTGTPIIENGRLDRFDVNGGSIAIEGQGLNASNIDQFDLITRSAKINAELHADKLNIIAGRNEVDASTLAATAKSPDGSDKPLLAIDSSALGGMYAGAIRLVGTEAGVGVKLAGDMAASAGDIQIDANGQLSMARTAANGNLIAKAESVELGADTYASGAVRVEATDTLGIAKSLAAGQGVVLSANQITNRGIVEAGIKADGSSNTLAALDIKSRSLINEGTLLASGRLDVETEGLIDNRGGTFAGAVTAIRSDSLANGGGRVLAEKRLSIVTGALDNRAGLLQSRGDAQLAASTLNNRAGDVVASGTLNASILTLDNTEQGRVMAGSVAGLEIDSLDNRGGVVSAAGSLTLKGDQIDNRDGGLIASEASLTLEASELDSSSGGEVSAGGDIRVTVKTLTQQQGRLISDGRIELDLQGGTLNNRQGLIKGQTGVAITDAGDLANQGGELSTNGNLHIEAERLVNADAGRVIAGGELVVQSDALDNHNGGLLSGWKGVTLQGGTLDNSAKGTVSSREGGVSTQLTGALNNSNEGALVSKQALTVTSGEIDNSEGGVLSSEASMSLQTAGTLNNAVGGLVNAGGALSIKASDVNNQSASVRSGADLLLDGRNLDNSNGQFSSDQTITLALTELLLNTGGQLGSASDLLMKTGEVDNRGGQLASQRLFELVTSRLDNSLAGTLAANGSLRLEVSGLLDNSQDGLIYSQTDTVTLQAATLNNQDGSIQGKTGLDVQVAGALDNRSGRLLGEQGDVFIEADSINNQDGLLTSLAGWITATANGLFDNQGGTIQADKLVLNAGALDNRGGHVSAVSGDTVIMPLP